MTVESFFEFKKRRLNEGRDVSRTIKTLQALIKDLEKGFVVFEYTKKSGELRTAFGTLRSDFIDKFFTPSEISPNSPRRNGYKAAKAKGYKTYFDLERGTFRQMRLNNGRVYELSVHDTIEDLVNDFPEMQKFKKDYLGF